MNTKVRLAFLLARWHYTPVIIIPVVLGAVLTWYHGYAFRWVDFVLCLVGAWFAHLGANAANDCFDDMSGVDRIAHETIPENRGSTVCGSEILTRGLMSRREGFIAATVSFAFLLSPSSNSIRRGPQNELKGAFTNLLTITPNFCPNVKTPI